MSLSKFLNWLHEEHCIFKLSSSEVRDIESSVYEGISAILHKGQQLKVEIPPHSYLLAEKLSIDKESPVETRYGDLFSVEEILPVGSFFEKTKIVLPNEFDFDIKLNVGKIDIQPGCRPGRVQVLFESCRQKWLQYLDELFCLMIDTAVKTMSLPEKNITRDSGTLQISENDVRGKQARIEFKWESANSDFTIHVDVVPFIPCTGVFFEELVKNERFPSNFHQLVRDHQCYLVPKSCSPECQKCFHVSFTNAELCLMQSLDEGHRHCYRILKWFLCFHNYYILSSYQLKMAVLDHVYNSNCQSKGCIEKCVIAMLEFLLSCFNDLKMPTFFLENCCVITKDGEGPQRYLDYLVQASDLDISMLPVEFGYKSAGNRYGKNYDWLDMFAWYEFQRRCLSLMIDVLRYFSQDAIKPGLSNSQMVNVLAEFSTCGSNGLRPAHQGNFSFGQRPTTREWRDNIPNFSQRVFIPAFALILEKIQTVLEERFVVPDEWSTPPIRLCLPCPIIGYSEGYFESIWQEGDLALRQGVKCYIAQLDGTSWCPVAFGKMSFIEPWFSAFQTLKTCFPRYTSLSKGGPLSHLVKGTNSMAESGIRGSTEEKEIPYFEGPFYHNVRYDGEAFHEHIVSCWQYKRCLIHLYLSRVVGIS